MAFLSPVPSPASRHLQLPIELRNIDGLTIRSRSPSRERDIADSTLTDTGTAELFYQIAEPGSSVALPEDGAARPASRCTTPLPLAPKLEPMSPLQLSDWRYTREPINCAPESKIKFIEPFAQSFSRRGIPQGWEACAHPEGKLYYRHPEKRILTHVNICNADRRSEIDSIYHIVMAKCRQFDGTIPENIELVVDLKVSGGPTTYCYYLVSCQARVIMWAEKTDVWYFTHYHRDVFCRAHLKHAMDWQFWTHVEMFPHRYPISDDLVTHLRNTLAYGWNDLMTSEVSTVPYDDMSISEATRLMSRMKGGVVDEHCAIVIARHMSTFCKERFYNYHGQPGARLNRDESLKEDTIHHPRSLTFLAISPLLFWMPDVYLVELEKIWVDETVNYRPWNKFIDELKRDWKASTTPATVLLSANVGFLAIQSIDIGDPDRSVSQIASYVSTLLSLTTYIVCQILARQHRAMAARADISGVARYLRNKEDLYYGIESLALAFSLPIASFIWSMVTFLLAVSYVCFFHTSFVTRIVTGASFVLLAIVIFLVTYMDWGENPSTRYDIRGSFWSQVSKRVRAKTQCYTKSESRFYRSINNIGRICGGFRGKRRDSNAV
ncbi:hypothetical protein QCA50_020258 [Cerrena zonata]|uniref:Uncharacterized protein n=1 Tax=Cerrena zonata TaxID=2478898 RepID=A0AAW0FCZ5_9APHY